MLSEAKKEHEILQAAAERFDANADWVTFFRDILGVGGVVRQHYQTRQALAAFERTEAYTQIQKMLAALRERQGVIPAPKGTTRVITVRLPKTLHEALKAEAYDHHTSMNQLCISKLLQFIDNELVPAE